MKSKQFYSFLVPLMAASFVAAEVENKDCMEENKMQKQLGNPNEVLLPFSEEARSVVVGGLYRHYKGLEYRVLSVGRHSESLEEMVVYQGLYGEKDVWVRPLSMFLETVVIEGKVQPRFACVDSLRD